MSEGAKPKVVKEIAYHHFHMRVLPRRCEDAAAADWHFEQHGIRKVTHRKMDSHETDRNQKEVAAPYPLFHFDISQYAHFGIGTGIYFLQILILVVFMFAAGVVLIPNIKAFGDRASSSSSASLKYTSLCNSFETVTLLDGEQAEFRNCTLPMYVGRLDLIMCLVLAGFMLLSKFIEGYFERSLDESVQTAQDYSIVVDDPNEDSGNPDEWCQFFSKFGVIRYVTIVRKNCDLCRLLLDKHLLEREIREEFLDFQSSELITQASRPEVVIAHPSLCGSDRYHAFLWKLRGINDKIELALKFTYPVHKVFVTFEFEDDQRDCLEQLRLSYIEGALDTGNRNNIGTVHQDGRKNVDTNVSVEKFRGQNALIVSEPAEPDNIDWQGIEVPVLERHMRKILSFIISIGALIASFFFTKWVKENSPDYLFIAVAAVDTIIPTFFSKCLLLERHLDEDDKQDSLLMRLFLARILNPLIMPFVFTNWDDFLKAETLNRIIGVQISTCFTAAVIQCFDFSGILYRHVIGPLSAKSQTELNAAWSGTEWSLAERYSGIGKILMISIVYAILTPVALFIAAAAFILTFFIDNYFLFRRWRPAPMLDPSMARRVRQFGMIALSAHMYISGRFIYSWPMDQAWFDTNKNGYVRVDKYPPLAPLNLVPQPWHNEEQTFIIRIYTAATIIVFISTFFVMFGEYIVQNLWALFIGDESSPVPQHSQPSAVTNIDSYCPTISNENEKFICSDTRFMKDCHHPPTFSNKIGDEVDIGKIVPDRIRASVLSLTKWYGQPEDDVKSVENGDVENQREPRRKVNKDMISRHDKMRDKIKSQHALEVAGIRPIMDRAVYSNGKQNDRAKSTFSPKLEMETPKEKAVPETLVVVTTPQEESQVMSYLAKAKRGPVGAYLNSKINRSSPQEKKEGKENVDSQNGPIARLPTGGRLPALNTAPKDEKAFATDLLPEEITILSKIRRGAIREYFQEEQSQILHSKRRERWSSKKSRHAKDLLDFDAFYELVSERFLATGESGSGEAELPAKRVCRRLFAKMCQLQKGDNSLDKEHRLRLFESGDLEWGFLSNWLINSLKTIKQIHD